MELVSIIVPVYNVEKYLWGCLNSLVDQTHQNLQIIVVDDGSRDDSGEICEEFARRDSRITVIHQENKGVSAARNAGLEKVRGEYLLFVDGDDTLEPDTVEVALRGFVNDTVDVVIFGVTKIWKDEQRRLDLALETGIFSKEQVLRGILKDYASMGAGFPVNKLWRIQTFGNVCEIPRFDESLYYFEDLEWVVRMVRQIQNANLLPHHFYHYYIHSSSATHAPGAQEHREIGYHQSIWKILCTLQQESDVASWFAQRYYPEIVNGVIHGWRQNWPDLVKLLAEKLPKIRHQVLSSNVIALNIKFRLLVLQILSSTGLL